MTKGEFTKEEADAVEKAVMDIMNSLSGKKFAKFQDRFGSIFLFLEAVRKVAPDE